MEHDLWWHAEADGAYSSDFTPYRLMPCIFGKTEWWDRMTIATRGFNAVDFAGEKRMEAIKNGEEITLTDKDMDFMFNAMFSDEKKLLKTKTNFHATSTESVSANEKIPMPELEFSEENGEKKACPCRLMKVSDGRHTVYLPISSRIKLNCKRFKISEEYSLRAPKRIPSINIMQTNRYTVRNVRRWRETAEDNVAKEERKRRKSQMVLYSSQFDPRYLERNTSKFPDTPECDVIGIIAQNQQSYVKPPENWRSGWWHNDIYYRPLSFDPKDPRAKQLRDGKIVTLTMDDLRDCFDEDCHFLASEKTSFADDVAIPENSQAFTLKHRGKGSEVTLLLPQNVHLDTQSLLGSKSLLVPHFQVEAAEVDRNGVVNLSQCEEPPTMVPSVMGKIHKMWDDYFADRHKKEKEVTQNALLLRMQALEDAGLKQGERNTRKKQQARKIARKKVHDTRIKFRQAKEEMRNR